jgi:hypothetical protein
METQEIDKLRQELGAFLADLGLLMGRKERQQHAQEYIRGAPHGWGKEVH